MKQILFMTSTIAPASNTFLLAHNDPRKRLRDYMEALRFYAGLLQRNIVDQLVYADNSGHDLSALRDIAEEAGVAERCEFISFRSETPPDVSRYFLEINLMREAMKRSAFMAGDDVAIWKATGRYIILNADRIIQRAPAQADLYVNCRNRPTRTVDFYFLRFDKAAFDTLLSADIEAYRNLRTGEDILRERIDAGAAAGLDLVPRFNETPRMTGTRGHDGARYGGAKDSVKYFMRYCMNRLVPGFWI